MYMYCRFKLPLQKVGCLCVFSLMVTPNSITWSCMSEECHSSQFQGEREVTACMNSLYLFIYFLNFYLYFYKSPRKNTDKLCVYVVQVANLLLPASWLYM